MIINSLDFLLLLILRSHIGIKIQGINFLAQWLGAKYVGRGLNPTTVVWGGDLMVPS